MQTRRLGRTDLDITRIGIGSWAIGGGDWEYGWGPQDDRQSVEAIHRGLDLGLNWIDTAAVYGLGHSEEIVAKALSGLAHKPYVFTKGGLRWNDKGEVRRDLKAASLRGEVEDSLRRLQVERIDLYQIHWPSVDIEEAWHMLVELQKQGKLRHIAVSNYSVDQMEKIRAIAPIASLQPPYSLVERTIEAEILPYCQKHEIGVIVYSPMASGLLSGGMTRERFDKLPVNDWRREKNPHYQEPEFTRNLALVETLKEIGARHGRSAGEVAIAWTLAHPAVTGAIVGVRRADQLDGVAGAASFELTIEDRAAIEAHIKN